MFAEGWALEKVTTKMKELQVQMDDLELLQ